MEIILGDESAPPPEPLLHTALVVCCLPVTRYENYRGSGMEPNVPEVFCYPGEDVKLELEQFAPLLTF